MSTPPPIDRVVPGAPARLPTSIAVPDTYTNIHRAVEAGDLASLRTAVAALPYAARSAAVNEPAHHTFKTSIMLRHITEGERNQTPLQIAILRFFEQPTAEQAAPYRAVVEELITLGANLKVTTTTGHSILMLAAKQASDTTVWHLSMIALLRDRILALPVNDRTAVLEQQSGVVFNLDQIFRLSSASAFMIAVLWLQPNIAKVLLPLMTDNVRTGEKNIAQDALEQLYARIKREPQTLFRTAETVTPDVQFAVNILKIMDLLVQYGASDEKNRIPALLARFLPKFIGKPLSVAIPAALADITWKRRASTLALRSQLLIAKQPAAAQAVVATPPKDASVAGAKRARGPENSSPASPSSKQPRFSVPTSPGTLRGTDGKPLPATPFRLQNSRHAQTLLARALGQ